MPVFNMAYAMESSNNDISYEEVIRNIDYDKIENSSEQESRFASVVLKLFLKIPKKIRTSKNLYVNLTKFKTKSGNKLIDKKTGWWIEKDRSNKPHGGSAYKIFDPNKKGSNKRHATLDKDGKVLRK